MPKIERATHTIDATDRPLGRVSTEIAKYLMGKHKATYTPHIDAGDFVKVVNASKVKLTGKKWDEMVHYRSSNRPGGIKRVAVKTLREERPEEIIRHSVKYMLPKNKQQNERMKRLTITK
ncbi:50S ribosomal protein L13 [Candidatus Uhrbacteria bacterium]|nr:50S ribosomal protein L13 [Candidatus Uhrbacteria bacterium]MBD3284000.1 50S ribosomal protein L13 [Candidatus Uhrbacteria bacterium]